MITIKILLLRSDSYGVVDGAGLGNHYRGFDHLLVKPIFFLVLLAICLDFLFKYFLLIYHFYLLDPSSIHPLFRAMRRWTKCDCTRRKRWTRNAFRVIEIREIRNVKNFSFLANTADQGLNLNSNTFLY